MPYTNRSLAFTWLIILALFAVSASGRLEGPWFILLLAVALTTPALVLRDAAAATSSSSNVQNDRTRTSDCEPRTFGVGSPRNGRRRTERTNVVPRVRRTRVLEA
jgi:uncharacterized protein (DUF58 family)